MPSKTLVDFVSEEASAYDAARRRAADALGPAQTQLAAAGATLGTLAGQLDTLVQEAAALRRDLAAATSQADAEHLAGEVAEKERDVHLAQAAIVAAQEQSDALAARVAALAQQADRAGAALRETQARAADAQARVQEQEAWAQAVAAAPLDGLPAGAGAAANAQGAAARDRLRDGDIPAALFDRAEARWTLAHDRLAAARVAAEAAEDAVAGEQGDLATKRLAYERARAGLRDYTSTAADRLDVAVALLTAVAAAPPLSPEAHDRLDGTAAPALVSDGEAAATKEAERDVKLADVDTARAAVDPARFAAIADNPDRNIEQVAEVVAANGAVTSAVADVPQADYLAVSAAINAWELAVPDPTWLLFADYERARALVADLAAATPATLASGLQAAEDAYAVALIDDGRKRRAGWLLDQFASERAGQAAAARRAEEGRLRAALRGDAWEAA